MKKAQQPSSGFKMLVLLLHVCKHIDVYGFGGAKGFYVWYWNKYQVRQRGAA